MKLVKSKEYIFLGVLLFCILLVILLSLISGQSNIDIKDVFSAIIGWGHDENINIIWNIRIPRIIVGFVVGATLSVGGLFTKIALKNPLADSGVLGIQTGATTVSIIIILLFPTLYFLLPIFAFIGGIIAFIIVALMSYKGGLRPINVVLSGVAVNAFFSAIIGIITIFNTMKLKDTLSYLNGSLSNITFDNMVVILIYSTILLAGSFIFLPVLKILKLDDTIISNLGKNPNVYRIVIALFAVFLASITASYVGVIGFIGILVPSIVDRIIKVDIKKQILYSILLGGLIIITCDFLQKIIFTPIEIPVGIIVGLIASPLYLLIVRRIVND